MRHNVKENVRGTMYMSKARCIEDIRGVRRCVENLRGVRRSVKRI